MGEHIWELACARVAEARGPDPLDFPLWIVNNSRHKAAAETALMNRLGAAAIPTHKIYTLLSLAGEVLNLPVLDVAVKSSFAVLSLRQLFMAQTPEVYRASSDSPGFAESFWSSVEEVENRGYFPDETLAITDTPPPPQPFSDLQRRLHAALEKRGRYTAGELLRRASRKLRGEGSIPILNDTVFIGPLLNPSALERDFIHTLISKVREILIFTIPHSNWHEKYTGHSSNFQPGHTLRAEVSLMRPLTPEAELEASFALIASWAAEKKYRYRDVRIIHPLGHQVLPQVESAARRYRVPLKGLVPRSLAEFPGVTLLLKLLDLFDHGWRREELLEVLRSSLIQAPWGEKSEVIKKVLKEGDKRSSAFWIELTKSVNAPGVAPSLEQLQQLDSIDNSRQTGRIFAKWIQQCSKYVREIKGDQPDKDCGDYYAGEIEISAWRSLDNLLKNFSVHFPKQLTRNRLLDEFKRALRATKFEPKDDRLDAVEFCPGTREEHLPKPVIIYLGLNSRVPSPGKSSPFLGTDAPGDYDEQFRLFQSLIGNGGDKVLLSCPLYDDEGDELTLSPFISSLQKRIGQISSFEKLPSLLPYEVYNKKKRATARIASHRPDAQISRNAALNYLRDKSLRWSATRLADAIQCPYLHFARNILNLEPLEDQISEGVTSRILGSIAHKALEEYLRSLNKNQPFDIEDWVRDEFGKKTKNFDPNPEMDRNLEELVRCLVDFTDRGGDRIVPEFNPEIFELPFGERKKHPPLICDLSVGKAQLEGKVDRIDEASDGRTIIIDYKYSKVENQSKEEFFSDIEQGESPQLPLYGLFVQEILGKRPVALFQIYLRSAAILGLKLEDIPEVTDDFKKGGEIRRISIEDRSRIFSAAVSVLEKKAQASASGQIQPKPKDAGRCGPGQCDFADLCRYRQPWKKN